MLSCQYMLADDDFRSVRPRMRLLFRADRFEPEACRFRVEGRQITHEHLLELVGLDLQLRDQIPEQRCDGGKGAVG